MLLLLCYAEQPSKYNGTTYEWTFPSDTDTMPENLQILMTMSTIPPLPQYVQNNAQSVQIAYLAESDTEGHGKQIIRIGSHCDHHHRPSKTFVAFLWSQMVQQEIYFNLCNRIKCGDMVSPYFNPTPCVSLFLLLLLIANGGGGQSIWSDYEENDYYRIIDLVRESAPELN